VCVPSNGVIFSDLECHFNYTPNHSIFDICITFLPALVLSTNHISGTAKARVVKFCRQVDYIIF